MKRLIVTLCIILVAVIAYPQNFLKKLGESAKEAAGNAIESNVDRSIEKSVDKAFDKDTYKRDKDKKKDKDSQDESNNESENTSSESSDNSNNSSKKEQTPEKTIEKAYSKCDFVAGDEIIFEDNLLGEKLGEFPSQWDIKSGSAEVASVGGENAIHLERDTRIIPFMSEKNYLPDEFTIEFDLYIPCDKDCGGKDKVSVNNGYDIELANEKGIEVLDISWSNGPSWGREFSVSWRWENGGESMSGNAAYMFKQSDFNHISISFNKRALKFYINGTRVANIPRCDAPSNFRIYSYSGEAQDERFIKNLRIAKGAVPLYDRMITDGKFITYGITFDVGKSTIKPESMGEINRIVKLMTDNPDLKFSVEGHTDNTGNATSNQTLSEARSKAIVDKLIELGIDKNRLSSSGKGQNSPIADNNTEEGRAKNRRVEFIKQ